MDPSKRICIKNLPDNCTKREIAEMIRSRTGAQPHSIDLGVDADGNTRKYAHFSCEGAKNVLEALSAGCSLRGNPIDAMPAKVHFSYRYAQARQKREREEAAEVEAREAFWEGVRRRLEEKGRCGEIASPPRRLRPFYFEKQKYATVASEIAARCREAFKARHPSSSHYRPQQHNQSIRDAKGASPLMTGETSSGLPKKPIGQQTRQLSEKKKEGPRANKTAKGAPAPPRPVPVAKPSASEPSKTERKLTGLQAKLALLKQKLAKKV
eukprot:gene5168-3716_t